jgi:large subunit ribosomal protein L9
VIEILLREHIDNLGRRGEVVSVASGYARNYLLPRKLALPVTAANTREVERERAAAVKVAAVERLAAEALAGRLAAVECVIARRVGETATLYGSVTNADIAEVLAAQQFDIDKRKIQLVDPIKEIGEFTVPVKLYQDVTAQLKVRVVKAETEGDTEPAADAAS